MRTERENLSIEWFAKSEELKKTKSVSRWLEMTVEEVVTLPYMLQFVTDVELYGLYEAVLYLPEDLVPGSEYSIRERVQDEILTDLRLKAIPKRKLSEIKPEGVVVPVTKTGLRPESVWALQKHLIVNHEWSARVEQTFNSILPFSAPEGVPRPFTSQDFGNIAQSTSVWFAVTQAPIKYRESLCQRLLTLFNIPDPEPPKNARHHIVEGHEKPKRDKVLVVDKAGNAWTWDCGWFRVREDGNRLDQKPAMGHASFRRNIKPADFTDYARTSFRYTRPWGQWRRGSGPVAHEQFGNGTLLLTDGVHAVVQFADKKVEVILDNLTYIGVNTVKRAKANDDSPKTARAKKKKAIEEMTLEELQKML